jgi:hypothetical protein
MRFSFNFGAFVRRLNTTKVGGIGLGTALTSAATIILAPKLQPTIDAHTSGLTQALADGTISAMFQGAQAALGPSIFAAWAGMPKPVQTQPEPPPDPGGNVLQFQTKRDSNAA